MLVASPLGGRHVDEAGISGDGECVLWWWRRCQTSRRWPAVLPSGARVKAFADRSEIVGLGFYVDESGVVVVLAVVGVGVPGTAVCCVVVKDEALVRVAGWSEGLTVTGVDSLFRF